MINLHHRSMSNVHFPFLSTNSAQHPHQHQHLTSSFPVSRKSHHIRINRCNVVKGHYQPTRTLASPLEPHEITRATRATAHRCRFCCIPGLLVTQNCAKDSGSPCPSCAMTASPRPNRRTPVVGEGDPDTCELRAASCTATTMPCRSPRLAYAVTPPSGPFSLTALAVLAVYGPSIPPTRAPQPVVAIRAV